MSLQKVDIPRQFIASLYGENLVWLSMNGPQKQNSPVGHSKDNVAEEVQTKQTDRISFLGQYQQKIIWLVNNEEHAFADKADMALLESILKACGLQLSDIALINLHGGSFNFEDLKTSFTPQRIIVLGSAFGFFPANLPLHAKTQFDDITVVTGASLQTMQSDKEAKGKLWNLLKPIFGK